ncbi:MAG TPA: DUF2177 family protein, partial [Edaphobacter sp.]
FLAVDYIWLSRAMSFYRSSLGDVLAEKPNLPAAAAFYLIYFVGIVVFAVMPAARNGGRVSALSLGGLLGAVRNAVGIRFSGFSGNMKVAFQATRSIG